MSPVGYQEHLIEGRMLPPRIRGSGLIDTGTTMSIVSGKIADALSLRILHAVEIRTALGFTAAPCYGTEFQFIDLAGARSHPLKLVVARVSDLGEDMVIGLDVLRQCRLEWDGPAEIFRLWPRSGRTGSG